MHDREALIAPVGFLPAERSMVDEVPIVGDEIEQALVVTRIQDALDLRRDALGRPVAASGEVPPSSR